MSVSFHMPQVLLAIAILALATALGIRMTGPSDMFHQTQPKTVSYTTDMIVNGRWLLPIERGDTPATKPLLYNWIAAPFVAVMGFDSELAHRAPSVIALTLAWLGIIVCAWRIAPHASPGLSSGVVGALAAMMMVSNYTMFKLGYLARPDMLLTLWLFLSWAASTSILVRARSSQGNASAGFAVVTFWAALALAWLTKGPAALVAVVYVIIAARVVSGRWSAIHEFKWWWGFPVSLLPFAAWVATLYVINPEHVIGTLWFDEFYGRVTGMSSAAPDEGSTAIITQILYMPAYFLVRFLPWSVLAIVGMVVLWWRVRTGGVMKQWQWQQFGAWGAWMHSGGVWIVTLVVIFSLSAGKRADYIAPAFPVAAMLAAWWWCTAARGRTHCYWMSVAGAVLALSTLGVVEYSDWQSKSRGYGDSINRFIHESVADIEREPGRLVFWNAGWSHLQAFVGASERDDSDALREALEAQRDFWLFSGLRANGDDATSAGIFSRYAVSLERVAQSEKLERTSTWPEQVILFRVRFVDTESVN